MAKQKKRQTDKPRYSSEDPPRPAQSVIECASDVAFLLRVQSNPILLLRVLFPLFALLRGENWKWLNGLAENRDRETNPEVEEAKDDGVAEPAATEPN